MYLKNEENPSINRKMKLKKKKRQPQFTQICSLHHPKTDLKVLGSSRCVLASSSSDFILLFLREKSDILSSSACSVRRGSMLGDLSLEQKRDLLSGHGPGQAAVGGPA